MPLAVPLAVARTINFNEFHLRECELFHTWWGLSCGNFAEESRHSTKRCPLWVKSGHVQCNSGCPLCANSGHWWLFNHLVGGVEEPFRSRQGECLSGFEIDHELELGWLLHWQIGRLFTFEDAIDIGCGPPK